MNLYNFNAILHERIVTGHGAFLKVIINLNHAFAKINLNENRAFAKINWVLKSGRQDLISVQYLS